jgi:S1-C subfamily serine protease
MTVKLTITVAVSTLLLCIAAGDSAFADSLWDHNGSVMRLVADGDQRQFLYERPRQILQGAGVGQGTILFDGYRVGNRYKGTAKRFSKNCPAPLPYEVSGTVVNETKVVLKGRREVYDDNCRPTGRFRTDTLVFSHLKTVKSLPSPTPQYTPAPSQPPAPKEIYETTGSGFTVSNDGFVLTNRHVVQNCQRIKVHDRGLAVIKELDDINDLALLKIQGTTSAVPFRSTSPSLGDSVFALGFPYAGVLGAGVNFTGGLISSLSGIGNDSRYLQFTAPIQPGNSGGPLVDAEGLVVGVVTSRLADIEMLKASGSLPQNVNFALRSELAKVFLKANGVEPVIAEKSNSLSASEIAKKAQAYTVQIICN